MAMKDCSAFPKAPALLEPQHQCFVLYQNTHCGVRSYSSTEMQSVYSAAPADWIKGHSLWEVLLLYRDTVGVFSSPIRLGQYY